LFEQKNLLMKILIIPTIREIYNKQFEFCIDIKVINFLRNIFKNASIKIYDNSNNFNYNLVVLVGGNNSLKQSGADKIRNKINNLVYNSAIKKNINILGICHGAHFLAKKNGFILDKKDNHVGSHPVIFRINGYNFKRIVNSYHNEIIKFKKINKVNTFGIAEDNTVEAFHVKSKKILGIIWHPERYNKFKDFDQKLIKKFYATNSIVGR
tara:strand:+ start:203 stop:832 length:630 start_codon:yes stop_codon:yes gene_type:complete